MSTVLVVVVVVVVEVVVVVLAIVVVAVVAVAATVAATVVVATILFHSKQPNHQAPGWPPSTLYMTTYTNAHGNTHEL